MLIHTMKRMQLKFLKIFKQKSLKVDFQFTNQQGDFVSVANSTEWHSFFENKTETEPEIETEIEEIESNNPKASFSTCFLSIYYTLNKKIIMPKKKKEEFNLCPFEQ